MSHETAIIDVRKLSDSEFAVLIRCCPPCEECADKEEINLQCKECHLHFHTMHSSVVNDDVKMAKSLEVAHGLAAENHKAALKAKSTLESMKGKQVQHE